MTVEIIEKIIDKMFQNGEIIEVILNVVKRQYGFIHKQTIAEFNGVKGFLIWDFIFWNEITFKDMDGNIFSLFHSISDKETEKMWEELSKKYGI